MVSLLNDSLSDPFVRFIAGIKGYKDKQDTDLMVLMARIKAEAELTDRNWNLFGYRRSPEPITYRQVLSKSREPVDIVFIPQSFDEELWKKAGKNPFPDLRGKISRLPCKRTAVLKEKEGSWPSVIPDHFRIWEGRWYNGIAKSNYYGLVIKDLELYSHGEWFLNPKGCSLRSNRKKTMTMSQRGGFVYRRKKEYSKSSELFPVIGKAKLIYPYSVRLYKPDFNS
jgi:hypothetical protein